MSPAKGNKTASPVKTDDSKVSKGKSPTKVKSPEKGTPVRKHKPKVYKLPVYRVRKVMKHVLSETNNGSVDAISQDAFHLAIKATEAFMMQLTKRAHTYAGKPSTLAYDDIAELIHADPAMSFSYLRAMVPKKMKYEDYLKSTKAKRKANTPLVGWIDYSKVKMNESKEQTIKRLTNDKYAGSYFRMIFTGDKSCLQDKNYLKTKQKIMRLKQQIYQDIVKEEKKR